MQCLYFFFFNRHILNSETATVMFQMRLSGFRVVDYLMVASYCIVRVQNSLVPMVQEISSISHEKTFSVFTELDTDQRHKIFLERARILPGP